MDNTQPTMYMCFLLFINKVGLTYKNNIRSIYFISFKKYHVV